MINSDDVVKVGNVDKPDAKRVRIVHISDTHFRHNDYLPLIPDGDILIHSGDFCKGGWRRLFVTPNYDDHIRQINDFFGKIPHKHKIFIGGNHDIAVSRKSQQDIQQLIPNVTYLQDSGVQIEGISIFGSPWTAQKWTSYARGFVEPWGKFEHHWEDVPDSTDVLVTHMPPLAIMDLAMVKFQFFRRQRPCAFCTGVIHQGVGHWGCAKLREQVLTRIRPKLHLYGHAHESAGIQTVENVVFSNGALPVHRKIHVFDFYV